MAATQSSAPSAFDFTLNSIDGNPAPLSRHKGKVMLIVNVASRCGFTPQYRGLEKLYETYRKKGLVVLGFPANNFGGQEPGTSEEIQTFCSRNYDVQFPMYSKISVKGEDQALLYRFLTSKEANPETAGEVQWNFTKFLVDRGGKVIARFAPEVTPESAEIIEAIETALK